MNKEDTLEFLEACNILKRLMPKIRSTDFNDEKMVQIAIELGVPLLHAGDKNMVYNMKYREVSGNIIRDQYFRSNSKNHPNGTDISFTPPCECKSMTKKTNKISLSVTIGEIDKVYNKVNNMDSKYSKNTDHHAIFLLYREASGTPFISFYVDNIDFGNVLEPLFISANNKLILKSNNLKVGARDSLTLKLSDFIKCKSLDIAHINNDGLIYFEQDVIEQADRKSKFYKSVMTAVKNDQIVIV